VYVSVIGTSPLLALAATAVTVTVEELAPERLTFELEVVQL
jgi:uncharacterized membrane protein YqiK